MVPHHKTNKIWRFCNKKQCKLTSCRTYCSIVKMRLLLHSESSISIEAPVLEMTYSFTRSMSYRGARSFDHSHTPCSGLFRDAVGKSNTLLSISLGWLVNNKLDRMQKEGVTLNTLIQHHSICTEENYATSPSRPPATGSKLLNPALQG